MEGPWDYVIKRPEYLLRPEVSSLRVCVLELVVGVWTGVGRHLAARVHGLVSGGSHQCDMRTTCPYLVGSGGVSIGAGFSAEIARFNGHAGRNAGKLMRPTGKECMRGLAIGAPHSARPGGAKERVVY